MAMSLSGAAAHSAHYAAIIAAADDLIARDGPFCPPSTSAPLWRAIDGMRSDGAPPSDVAIAEEISVMLARMQRKLGRDGATGNDPSVSGRQAAEITARAMLLSRALLMTLPMDFSRA